MLWCDFGASEWGPQPAVGPKLHQSSLILVATPNKRKKHQECGFLVVKTPFSQTLTPKPRTPTSHHQQYKTPLNLTLTITPGPIDPTTKDSLNQRDYFPSLRKHLKIIRFYFVNLQIENTMKLRG